MEKRKDLMIAAIVLVVLGMVMIYLGAFGGPAMMLPPIITGLGFFVIAWALNKLR